MIEVVFGESARGSMLQGQRFKDRPYRSGNVGVVYRRSGGGAPTEAERNEALRRAEAQRRREWEEGASMPEEPRTILAFPVGLSVGDISGEVFGERRRSALRPFYEVYRDEETERRMERDMEKVRENLRTLLSAAAAGEPVRVWYSDNPDELCGACWIVAQLAAVDDRGAVYTVPLPRLEVQSNRELHQKLSWGEASPGEWGKYVPTAEKLAETVLRACKMRWNALCAENAPLRAVVNGRLLGVEETFYDGFIRREIARSEETFNEACLIGRVMGQYQLGISDGWIALRIRTMIDAGELAVVEEAPEDAPVYRRILRKNGHNKTK